MRNGYCAVTADILHTGHIDFIRKCKQNCDNLTVGVMSDGYIRNNKNRKPTLNFEERADIVIALEDVDMVIKQHSFEFPKHILNNYDIIFDSEQHNRKGATMLFPYKKGISSSKIKSWIISDYLQSNYCLSR